MHVHHSHGPALAGRRVTGVVTATNRTGQATLCLRLPGSLRVSERRVMLPGAGFGVVGEDQSVHAQRGVDG